MTESSTSPTKSRRRWPLVAGLAVALLGIGWALWPAANKPDVEASALLKQARVLQARGELVEAEALAAKALDADPELGAAAMLAAECAAGRGEAGQAVTWLERIPDSDRELAFRGRLHAAQLLHQVLMRWLDAEGAYRAALELAPGNVDASIGLARLLGQCGRRREAIPYVLRLVQAGDPTDLLMLLARDNGVIHIEDRLEQAFGKNADDPNILIGLAWHAAEEDNVDRAIALLRQAMEHPQCPVVAHVMHGQRLLDQQRFDELIEWERTVPDEADRFPETWLVRARMADQAGDRPGAIRCYAEAFQRAPESKPACFGLSRLLSEASEATAAEPFAAWLQELQELENEQNRVLFAGQHETVDPLIGLVRRYAAVGRLWEAYGWCLLALDVDSTHQQARQLFAELRQRVAELPLQLVAPGVGPDVSELLARYPLPTFDTGALPEVDPDRGDGDASVATDISFRDDAERVGLAFRYCNGTLGEPTRRMYEFTGGGIGVLDYDRDGMPDVHFTQGHPWDDPDPDGPYVDQLFRNVAATAFRNVTTAARIREAGFGQGVTVGDIDGDGFPDLYVANIGGNRLWLNNGDGTFSDATEAAGIAGEAWTTSCLLADLTGDGLPDLYDVNYVTAPDVFERICPRPDGTPGMCMPFHFDSQPDRLLVNDGEGGFVDATTERLPEHTAGKGLGIALWRETDTGRLNLFVANDTTPNFLFTGDASDGSLQLEEQGIASGLAFNAAGKAEGCMGIAVGDVDGNGHLDLHVTNFYNESNTLYAGVGNSIFEDRTRQWGLEESSLPVLGFGTQFLDANADGRLELFVTNGHLDDLRASGRPYRMPPQLYLWDGGGFVSGDPAKLGAYFQQEWLGRPAAKLDWNRDGREDLIVGHLEDDVALLTNAGPEAGHGLALTLVGTRSGRDAIGTTFTARVGKRTIVRQLTAGDGYQVSNERRVIIGTGSAEVIDELVIRWPSGAVQTFRDVATADGPSLSGGMLLIEEAMLRRLPPAG
ncbi:tetratricopeptide repeat protein [Maioricimonas rarisocia]|uniref:Tetratricopeptide repeat protein n=1 Tax=Maioricimonas rarisocia TaxID=2528026 RepID=A0A517Z1H7_9PLAN|nr:FG-GAP-like repeat-containing protein [Maioricimonas rarisocia]QDU36340.1 tetratricopeptide repeat protein [Maioricimonas rarisocia]